MEPNQFIPFSRESDQKWFAALQPHLRTPACVIAEEAKSERTGSLQDLSETPTIKQRTKNAAKESSKDIANKLDFSSSSEDEIMEKLKAHNKRIQSKGQRSTPPLKQPVSVITSNPNTSSHQVKRRSCAPLLLQKKLAVNRKKPCFESVIESSVTATHSPPNISSQELRESPKNVLSSKAADKRKSCVPFVAQSKATAKNGTFKKPLSEVKNNSSSSIRNKTSEFSTDRQSKKVAKKSTTRPSSVVKSQSSVTKSSSVSNKAVMRPSTRPQSSENKTKPVIKSAPSSRPPSKPSKSKPVGLKNKVKTTTSTKVSSSVAQKSISSSIRSKPQPSRASTQQSIREDPFKATSSVLSIINSKTPHRSREPVKSKESHVRYSVETPSPPQPYILESAGSQACDDGESSDDLDAYMVEKLKAHNAKIMSNIRVPGKAIKTTKNPKQVSLHLGSPSRPKIKVSRSKLS